MIKITVIAVGRLKEKYLYDACCEYIKRLGLFAKPNVVEIAEERCGDNPSASEIENVKQKEGQRIIAKIPKIVKVLFFKKKLCFSISITSSV